MRILFVAPHINPFERPINGDSQRTQLLLRSCVAMGDVDVAMFTKATSTSNIDARIVFADNVKCYIPKVNKVAKWLNLLKIWNVQSLFPIDKGRKCVLDTIIAENQYDLIVCRYFYRALTCGLWDYRDRLIVDFDDALPFYFLEQIKVDSKWSTRLRMRIAAKEAAWITVWATKRLKYSFFANSDAVPKVKSSFLPNIPFYQNTCGQVDFSTTPTCLLFVGQIEYGPNQKGLDYFIKNVYVQLQQKVPGIKFSIVGRCDNHELRKDWESFPGVELRGYVDDLSAEYESCRVVVVPVYNCGGTNIKLLEAMRMNRACVATIEAAEALGKTFLANDDLYVANTSQEFVDKVFRLLTDEAENLRVARNALTKMKQYYTFDAFSRIVSDALTQE